MIKLLFILLPFYCITQTYLVDQHFSNVAPTGWSSTSNVWNFARNESATGNYRNVYDATTYSARFASAANGNSIYLYIPINFVSGNTYTITFYTKRACSVVVNTNELPNQTTLLTTDQASNANCNSNWNTWYQWSFSVVPGYTGSGYFQIWIKTIYGGPTSVYLDDVTILETIPTTLPIELLNFTAWATDDGKLVSDWEVASEQNVWKYYIMRSIDGTRFHKADSLVDIGSSSHPRKYRVITNNDVPGIIIYVMLRELDTDNKITEFNPVAVLMPNSPRRVIGIYNCLGQAVTITEPGVIIIIYDDGSKQYKINR